MSHQHLIAQEAPTDTSILFPKITSAVADIQKARELVHRALRKIHRDDTEGPYRPQALVMGKVVGPMLVDMMFMTQDFCAAVRLMETKLLEAAADCQGVTYAEAKKRLNGTGTMRGSGAAAVSRQDNPHAARAGRADRRTETCASLE